MGSKLRVAACIMYVNALFGWWRPGGSTCDSAPRSGRARADGGGGRVRHPATRSQRGGAGGGGAERARGHQTTKGTLRRDFAKGLCEGTLRRDFAKGLCEGTSLDFSKGLSKGLFSQGLNIFGTTINNRFKDNGDYTGCNNGRSLTRQVSKLGCLRGLTGIGFNNTFTMPRTADACTAVKPTHSAHSSNFNDTGKHLCCVYCSGASSCCSAPSTARRHTVTASTVVTCAAGFASTADTCFASTVATGTTAAADSCSVCRRRRRGAASAAASEVTTAPGREALAPRPLGDPSGDPGDLSGDASGDLSGDPEGHRRDTARRHLGQSCARRAPKFRCLISFFWAPNCSKVLPLVLAIFSASIYQQPPGAALKAHVSIDGCSAHKLWATGGIGSRHGLCLSQGR